MKYLSMIHKGKKVETQNQNVSDFHGFGNSIRKEIASKINIKTNLRILDVGTGFGRNVRFLANIIPLPREIWSIDADEDVIKRVKTELEKEKIGEGIYFKQALVEDLPFEDNYFDYTISVMLLHHMSSIEKGIKEMFRVTKNGGMVIIVDYAPDAHTLHFTTPHNKSDFFEPEKVVEIIRNLCNNYEVKNFKMWYLVSAIKT
ncbi:class I SAM-dependent methyltransferase [Sulfolobus sp. E11-6]|uniref:class I SAM-dependent methyltransferase n=1 Tax=Sulfolobus sp. E11-6 TaxID=2663020 RepID=UPI001294B13B|nr:class I SAM-dependent methyltransferase [Sulfolobus sp. E11-6]QGA69007.1 methyltransferase domain-containing protein [Sulfolobus sp. E11-6]